jgi:hypothetical protein
MAKRQSLISELIAFTALIFLSSTPAAPSIYTLY